MRMKCENEMVDWRMKCENEMVDWSLVVCLNSSHVRRSLVVTIKVARTVDGNRAGQFVSFEISSQHLSDSTVRPNGIV
jgi:hypothetical protein